ncbi:matrix remodeling-associated protein 8-like [Anguilla anguilla]|uniref:matrix remodeling-associated protein 8-like n=1 Tax=Anguilla anguilla TaxID=7936 RepID=UPI0015B23CD8|nr:matrix remodeling-associated protein 8-like [Anguilla anguilla]
METARVNIIARILLLFQIPASFLHTVVSGQNGGESVVVAVYNISAPTGSEAVLQCHSQRMVWTQDRLKDRQRVVHWDLFRSPPDFAMERLLDMFSAGDQRIYNGYNKDRVSMSKTAFDDGNFSLVIKDVSTSDRGIYSCNLHHHYCHLYETTKVQLNVTKSPRKERRFWDGEKAVFVALAGSTVVLPCVNRRPVWTESHGEEDQQVVHWDRQLPGVRHDRADRLIDLYASGERRQYGPLFLQRKMNITGDAFSRGDFSLTIADLRWPDQGVYSCHLHHHYCGLDERRIFHLSVGPPAPAAPAAPVPAHPDLTTAPHVLPNDDPHTNVVEVPHVINFIVPEHRGHFLQQLGYILATVLMLALIAIGLILLSRRCKKRALEYDLRRSERGNVTTNDFEMGVTELKMCNQEEMRRDYKNNLLKEKAEMCKLPSPKVIDLDKEMDKTAWK